jgi:hypothetical protein
MDAYLLPAYRDELEKRRGDACALQSFAKHENALRQLRTQCFWSAMSLASLLSSHWEPNSLPGRHHILAEARCVRVGQIRGVLIRLIEHFSSAAGISCVFLHQSGDEPDIVLW